MSANVLQTTTPFDFIGGPDKEKLVAEFKGKPLNALRTPALVVDRAVFKKNCELMHENAKQWGDVFRAHVKSHKTAEGTRMQLVSSVDKTDAIVVSTLMEAYGVVRAGLVADGTVKDILYGLPVGLNKVQDLSSLWDEIAPFDAVIRLLVDHPEQVKFLEAFEQTRAQPRQWSVFIKVDCGSKRAGLQANTPVFQELLQAVFSSPAVSVHGFYTHGSSSYASTSVSEASSYLTIELEAVNTAAGVALEFLKSHPELTGPSKPFVIAAGSTPSAHVATAEARAQIKAHLYGILEIHAGNYPLLDLQQVNTSLVDHRRVAQRVLTTVVSYYPGRGKDGTDEALCDAGAIAMSKDSGRKPGFGEVLGKPWSLGRISQEHGVLTQTGAAEREEDKVKVGDIVEIVGQHACLILAAYPWYYVVDSDTDSQGEVVEDVWVPWKGW
ncbi:putative serine dehydratase domain-containing protein [Fomitopsis serialis]|uniref:putative serine dehydratase domain-containing protein n=1 Tax=Fomitopsis serialis TaxID=139415 RepID=UPI00200820B7|nr:putative serine dehydratase domain-containing protein [Neoantrodia serialis]KAH9919093.1 putative serine dehydratase domain-containing protein [Neoantrodia serialis]